LLKALSEEKEKNSKANSQIINSSKIISELKKKIIKFE
jgi:hypothetical protein